jgi:uncharacterized protein YbaR (Trm112 family)
MEETFLDLLCTPLNHAVLRLACPEELAAINDRIRQRLVRTRDGLTLDLELDDCLICESERTGYPIRDGLPVLIAGEAFTWPPIP